MQMIRPGTRAGPLRRGNNRIWVERLSLQESSAAAQSGGDRDNSVDRDASHTGSAIRANSPASDKDPLRNPAGHGDPGSRPVGTNAWIRQRPSRYTAAVASHQLWGTFPPELSQAHPVVSFLPPGAGKEDTR